MIEKYRVNGSTSGPTPWQIYDDIDDVGYGDEIKSILFIFWHFVPLLRFPSKKSTQLIRVITSLWFLSCCICSFISDTYTTWYAATTPCLQKVAAYDAHLANYTLYNRFVHNMICCHKTLFTKSSSIRRTRNQLHTLQQIPTQHDMLPQHLVYKK